MQISKINIVEHVNYNKSANNTITPHMQVQTTAKQITEISNYSYGKDLINKKSISFGANPNDVNKAAIALLHQFPVEERLASLFQTLKHGEIIVLGKDFNQAQISLHKNLKKLAQAIKKEIFMPESSLERNYAFIKNSMGDIELLNINDKKLSLITGGRQYYLDPGDSFYIVNNDTIQIANDVLHIKDKPKHDLSAMKAGFSKVLDFSEEVQQELAKLNKRTISKKILQAQTPVAKLTFSKIGGQDKAIEELKKSILFPIKYPSAFAPEDITRGFILHGPAGTGKTAICRALANEANVNSSYISGTAFQSKWVGESEGNVRAFFDGLKENQPSIGVIDEIDAIGASRGRGDNYGDKLIDQLLTCITDIHENGDNVYIIGLTNRYDMLDPALKRSERLSKHIYMGPPDKEGVKAILDIHTNGKPLAEDINKEELVNKLYDIKAVGSDILYITKQARENMMTRLGVYEKMNNGTFDENIMKDAKISHQDFLNAIEQFKTQNKKSTRNPVGFIK